MSTLVIPKVAGTVNSVNGKTGVVTLSTVDVPEQTNQYYTNARARSAISVTSVSSLGLNYDSSTGIFYLSGGIPSAARTIVIRDQNGVIYSSGIQASGNTIVSLLTATQTTITNTLSVQNRIDTVDLYVYGAATVNGTATFNGNAVYSGAITINGVSGLAWAQDGFVVRKATSSDINSVVAGTTVFALNTALSAIYTQVTTTDPLTSAFSKINAQLQALSALVLQLGKTI